MRFTMLIIPFGYDFSDEVQQAVAGLTELQGRVISR